PGSGPAPRRFAPKPPPRRRILDETLERIAPEAAAAYILAEMRSRVLPLILVVLCAVALTLVVPMIATHNWGQVTFLVILVLIVMIAGWLPDFERGRLKAPGRWFEITVIILCLLGCVFYIADRGGFQEALRLSYGRGKSSSALFLAPFNSLMLGTLLMAWRL